MGNKIRLIIIFLTLLLISVPAYAGIGGDIRQGNKLYEQKDFTKAKKKYDKALKKNPESDIINFNAGTAAYKVGDYKTAANHFQKALLSENSQLKQKAHYNLGDTFYRLGEQAGPKNSQAAIQSLEKSLAQYESVLKINKDDKDAKFNYDFVKKVLEKIKKQVKKQQQQRQKAGQKKSQQNQQKQQGQKDQQQSAGQQGKQGQQGQKNKEQQKQGQEKKKQEEGAKKQNQGGAQQKKDQEKGNSDQKEKQSGSSAQGGDANEMSRREAQMRLNDYENNQEPKGMLNLRGQFDTRPVLKDW